MHKTSEEYLMNLWRRAAGCELNESESELLDYNSLKKTEWSDEFERAMRYRLIIGTFRYGKMNSLGKKKYDRVSDIKRRIDAYATDGNLEHLVDVANLSMLEFVEGDHPKKHFISADDREHTNEKRT